MKLVITIDLIPCETPPGPPDAEGVQNIGHMHIVTTNAEITAVVDGVRKNYGNIGMDPGASIMLGIGGTRYHVAGLQLWQVIRDGLAQTQTKVPEDQQSIFNRGYNAGRRAGIDEGYSRSRNRPGDGDMGG